MVVYLICGFVLSGLFFGAVLLAWPRALIGVGATACLAVLLLNGWSLIGAAGCWECRGGEELADGTRALLGLTITMVWLMIFLTLMGIGAGVAFVIRTVLR